MYAVIRETRFPADPPLEQRPEFREFQEIHAQQPGYRGTVVTHVGEGLYYTTTLWSSAEEMHAARMALEPVVRRLLDPWMTAPPRLLGTGPVVASDLAGAEAPQRQKRLLRVDRGDLLLAFGDHEMENYLDLATGEVFPVLDDFSDETEDRARIEEDPDRYLPVEPVPSHEGFRWMEDFAREQESDKVRRDLLRALERRRPFRSFKDELMSYPETRSEWFIYEEKRLLEHAREWLSAEGVDVEIVDMPPPSRLADGSGAEDVC